MEHYSTSERIVKAVTIVVVLIDLVIAGLIIRQRVEARREAWAHSYPMANQHIEWTGAGYQHIGR